MPKLSFQAISTPAGAARVAAALAVTFVCVRSAWVCDDAFITMRTVDNLVHGYGPRWNPAERVQTFTHPLWAMLLVPFYAVTREGGGARGISAIAAPASRTRSSMARSSSKSMGLVM